jgi:hypothetical protein
MTTNEMPGPSGIVPDRYLEDISADELSANAPTDEPTPIGMLNVNAIESGTNGANVFASPFPSGTSRKPSTKLRAGCTLPQSITTIARQAQGMRAGEVIAKLTEDAYFMRVDNRVTQVPPVRNRQ